MDCKYSDNNGRCKLWDVCGLTTMISKEYLIDSCDDNGICLVENDSCRYFEED